jgi:hypothetical protein
VSLRLHCLQTSLTQQGRLHTTKQDHLNKIAELKCVFLKTQLTKKYLKLLHFIMNDKSKISSFKESTVLHCLTTSPGDFIVQTS